MEVGDENTWFTECLRFYRFVGVFKLNKEKSIKENKCVWERISNTYQLNV